MIRIRLSHWFVILPIILLLGGCVSEAKCERIYRLPLALADHYNNDSRNIDLIQDTYIALIKCRSITNKVLLSVNMSDGGIGILGEEQHYGNIALLAAQINDVALLQELKAEGIDISGGVPKSKAHSSLHLAVRFGSDDAVEWLLAQGMSPDTKSYGSLTPLTEASIATKHHRRAVSLILDAGANPDAITDLDSLTVLEYLDWIRHREEAEWIRKYVSGSRQEGS